MVGWLVSGLVLLCKDDKLSPRNEMVKCIYLIKTVLFPDTLGPIIEGRDCNAQLGGRKFGLGEIEDCGDEFGSQSLAGPIGLNP